MSLRRTDTDKDNCRLKRKHCFFQSHAGAVKSHKDILFQWLLLSCRWCLISTWAICPSVTGDSQFLSLPCLRTVASQSLVHPSFESCLRDNNQSRTDLCFLCIFLRIIQQEPQRYFLPPNWFLPFMVPLNSLPLWWVNKCDFVRLLLC